MPSSCAACLKEGASSICSRCKCTYYCNIQCQRANWKQHKKICKSLTQSNKTNSIDDEKSILTNQDTKQLKEFVSKINRNVLCNHIVENCIWDMNNLNELINTLQNIKQPTNFNAPKWINKVNPIAYDYNNGYSFGFKDLTILRFESIKITKEFLNIFTHSNDHLKTLQIDDCSFSDQMHINFLKHFFHKNKNNNKLETLSLWEWEYGNTTRHQLFTNYLIRSKSLKSLTIRLYSQSKYTPNLSVLIHSKLENIYLYGMNHNDINYIINGKSDLLKILKQCKYLNEIKLDAEAIMYDIIPNVKEGGTITSEMFAIVDKLVQLFCLFKNLLHDLQRLYHSNGIKLQSFGKLDMKGAVSKYFIQILDEKYNDNNVPLNRYKCIIIKLSNKYISESSDFCINIDWNTRYSILEWINLYCYDNTHNNEFGEQQYCEMYCLFEKCRK
eukprot:128600_1